MDSSALPQRFMTRGLTLQIVASRCDPSIFVGKGFRYEWANPTGHSFYHWVLRERVTGQVEVD
jgi:hypothetical protein